MFSAAQVSVEVVVEQEQFLRDEALPVKVRITNRSGQALRFEREGEWLAFAVESLDGHVVSRLAEVPSLDGFTLESARVATREVDLARCFDLNQPGRYTVTANVKINEWKDEVPGQAKGFEVVRGTKLWEQEFGVPTNSGTPEARRYTLQQANYRKQLRLYLRLTDLSEQRVFRVFPLGPLVSFSQPEVQMDKSSYLHVLFQTGARSFLFHVINPEGDVMVRQTYDYTASRPTLRSTEEGRIFVAGGARRMAKSDLPAPLPGVAAVSTTNSNAPPLPNGVTRIDGKSPRK